MNIEQKAKVLGCTVEQLKAQYAANVVTLREMLARAESTGNRVNGYTAAEIVANIQKFEELAK